jgi:hypothetical protein
MIIELNRENCWSIAHDSDDAVLVAYLSRTASSRELKALIELSEEFSDLLTIYVTRDMALKVSGNGEHITGTPTYLLVCNDLEENRLLGEADVQRLKKFVSLYLQGPACTAQDDSDKLRSKHGEPLFRPECLTDARVDAAIKI